MEVIMNDIKVAILRIRRAIRLCLGYFIWFIFLATFLGGFFMLLSEIIIPIVKIFLTDEGNIMDIFADSDIISLVFLLCLGLLSYFLSIRFLIVADKLKEKIDMLESAMYGPKASPYSSSSYSGTSGSSTSFNPDTYVRDNCTSWRYGTKSYNEIEAIRGDSTLTSEQKAAAEKQLDYLSGMYY